jgi:hypothetical protein
MKKKERICNNFYKIPMRKQIKKYIFTEQLYNFKNIIPYEDLM